MVLFKLVLLATLGCNQQLENTPCTVRYWASALHLQGGPLGP
jgi:hypothetical protein